MRLLIYKNYQMCYCVICGKKLRPFKTTRDWKDRNTHLKCRTNSKIREQRRLKYFIELYKDICIDKSWDYDYETNKIIDKRI